MVDLTEGLRHTGNNPSSILDLVQKNREQNIRNTLNQQAVTRGQDNIQSSRQNQTQDIIRKKFDLLSDREKMREKSLFQGALQIKPLLDAGDVQGAMRVLQDRSQRLESLGIDSTDTQRVLQQLQNGDIDNVNRAVNGQIKAFQMINNPNQNIPAGITYANELRDARARGDTQRVNDILNVLKVQKLPTGTTIDEQGNVQNITGIPQALGGQAFATGQGSQAGKDTAIIASQPTKDELELDKQSRSQDLENKQKDDLKLQELTQSLPVARETTVNSIMGIDDTISKLEEAKSMVGNNTAGWGSFLTSLPATEANDLEAQLLTVNSRFGLDSLLSLKNKGGSLGAIAVKEFEALQSSVSNLRQSQSPQQLRKNFDSAIQQSKRTQDSIERAFKAEYGRVLGQPEPQQSEPSQQQEEFNLDDLINQYGNM